MFEAILTYHNVAPLPKKDMAHKGLFVSPNLFKWQMRILKWLGYRGVSLSEYFSIKSETPKARLVAITFDDGYQDNLIYALPILKHFGFTATCYVVSDLVGQCNRWDAKKLNIEKPLMTQEEVKQWLANGMEIGAHTKTHPHLSQLDEEAQKEEITGAKQALESQFHVPVKHFCYPYGDFNDTTIKLAKKTGFETATTTVRGRLQNNDLFLLPRIAITRNTWPHLFLLKLLTHYEDKRGRRQDGK